MLKRIFLLITSSLLVFLLFLYTPVWAQISGQSTCGTDLNCDTYTDLSDILFLISSIFNPVSNRCYLMSADILNNKSVAKGKALIKIDTQSDVLTYRILAKNLTSPETASHIHGFVPEGQSAGIVHPLSTGLYKEGTWNYLPSQEQNILNGLSYINIHTTNYPSGEIEGWIKNKVVIDCATPLAYPSIQFKTSLGPEGNFTPQAKGEVILELDSNNPNIGNGLVKLELSGTLNNLEPNTLYEVWWCNLLGGCSTNSNPPVITDALGSVYFQGLIGSEDLNSFNILKITVNEESVPGPVDPSKCLHITSDSPACLKGSLIIN